jgi:hypothetical protein
MVRCDADDVRCDRQIGLEDDIHYQIGLFGG